MSQTFSVNGKEYFQSSVLAASFGYSSDHIAKLARQEKILGVQIDRQWFIEPESLKTFLLQVAVEKKIRKEELHLERKAVLASGLRQIAKKKSPYAPSAAFLQALAIFVSGSLLGGFSFIAASERISLADAVIEAAEEEVQFAADILAPSASALASLGQNRSLKASSFEGLNQSEEVAEPQEEHPGDIGDFATLPVFPNRYPLQNSTSSNDMDDGPEFSDEIKVLMVDKDGNKLIQPVFKSRATGSPKYLVIPVD